MSRHSCAAWIVPTMALLAVSSWSAPSAFGSPNSPGVGWEVTATNWPTNLRPDGHGTIDIDVFNIGASASSGLVTVTDTLPHGLTATEAGELHLGIQPKPEEPKITNELWACTGNGPGEVVAGATVV